MSSTSGEPLQPSMSTTSATASSSSSQPKTSSIPATDRQIAEARAALEASMRNIGSHLDNTLRSRATDLHHNNAALDKQIVELEESTKLLAKTTDKLKKISDDASRRLKEVGNVQNWAEVMEREFLILEETVRLADLSEPEEDYGPCRVCGKEVECDADEVDDILFCYSCDGEFHPPCVGLEAKPNGEWHCAECQQQGTYLQNVKAATDDGTVHHPEQEHTVVHGVDFEMDGMDTGGMDVAENRTSKERLAPGEGMADGVPTTTAMVHDLIINESTVQA